MPKKTFECAKTAEADLIVQIKSNQESLYKQVVHGCNISKPIARVEDALSKEHGRLEKRTYEVFCPDIFLKKWPEWSEIKQIIRVTRFRNPTHTKESPPLSFYYACNAHLKAEVCAKAIRLHWWCENKNHYVRDTGFLEDSTTKKLGAFNFCVLLSSAMNILRFYGCKNIRGKLYEKSMGFNNTMNLFVG